MILGCGEGADDGCPAGGKLGSIDVEDEGSV